METLVQKRERLTKEEVFLRLNGWEKRGNALSTRDPLDGRMRPPFDYWNRPQAKEERQRQIWHTREEAIKAT